MKARARFAVVLGVSLVTVAASACSRGHDAAGAGPDPGKHPSETLAISAPPLNAPACGHAVCADNFFIDAAPAGDCTAGSACGVALKLVATGDFHINDEYPYRFKADDAPGVDFLGKDDGGKNTFSKAAGDWQKTDAKSGAMTVKFIPTDASAKSIGGTLKLSVCSAGACLLEQRQVTTTVTAR